VIAIGVPMSVSALESWPMAGRDATHTGTVSGPAPPYRVAWELQGEAAPVTGVAATDEAVVVMTSEGVHALDPVNGDVLWERGRPPGPTGVPAIAGKLVIHARDEGVGGQLVARDIETGELAWQAPLGSAPVGGPTVSEGAVFVGTGAGEVVALDLATGKERWRFETVGGVAGAPAVSDGIVVAAGYQASTGLSTVYAIDAEVGQEDGPLWRYGSGPAGPPSAPSIAGGLAYIGLGEREVRAVDLGDGAERWSFSSRDEFGPRQIPAAGDALVLADRTHLYRLDPSSGEQRWSWLLADLSPLPGDRVETLLSSSPVVSGTTALLGSASGELSAIDVDSGRRVWRMDLGDGAAGPIAVTSDHVYAVTLGEDGSLVALQHDPEGSLLDEVSPTVLFVGDALVNFAGGAVAVGLAIWLLFRFALRPRT
jgi:outer membrane protein assembly factor BamB